MIRLVRCSKPFLRVRTVISYARYGSPVMAALCLPVLIEGSLSLTETNGMQCPVLKGESFIRSKRQWMTRSSVLQTGFMIRRASFLHPEMFGAWCYSRVIYLRRSMGEA